MENTTNAPSNGQPAIIRTARGLTIASTRTTLYRIMDYVKADWPPKLIRDRLNLTDQQVAAALAYINEHSEEVEAEYRQVLESAEENRRRSAEGLRAHLAARPPKPPKPEEAALRAKLEKEKARLGLE